MELTSLEKREILLDSLQQIRQSCENLMSWNKDVKDMKVLLNSSTGMQDLAGNCMTVMAIGEGFRKIDKITDGKFLILRPEIPWNQVFGLRNRIAHGYFDIDVDVISDVVNNDLQPLLEAIDYFIEYLKNKD
ncbi:MAG: DUF86 domain-containing protein [Bacteroidales bacterium]|nr:DUF86 domain-containing protein [Bacteroidales bacterium]